MTESNETNAELAELTTDALDELTRRVEAISNSYRAVAEKKKTARRKGAM